MARFLCVFSVLLAISLGACGHRAENKYLSNFARCTFNGSDHAWLVTREGNLYTTVDAGKAWQKILSGIGKFQNVSFVNEKQGWALSKIGQIWQSMNGGQTWKLIGGLKETTVEINSSDYITFTDSQHGWVISSPFIWYSNDGGYRWKKCSPIGESNRRVADVGKAAFLDADIAWVGGDNGRIYYTSKNVCSQWRSTVVANVEAMFHGVYFVSNQVGWANGWPNGGIYNTQNGGESWELQLSQKPGDKILITDMHFISEKEGWLAGMTWSDTEAPGTSERKWAVMLNTIDGGKNWQPLYTTESELFYNQVYFSDTRNGWAISPQNVYRSTDGGKVWNKVFEYKTQ